MRNSARLVLLILLASTIGAAFGQGMAIPGRFDGQIRIASEGDPAAQVEAFSLRILPEGFGLIDFPNKRIFGFPVAPLSLVGGDLVMTIGSGEGAIHFFGAWDEGGRRIVGTASQAGLSGEFSLAPAPLNEGYGSPVEFGVAGGRLRGSLLLPVPVPRGTSLPLVVFVSGPGSTDRDGNNYQVPGRSDSLAMLASALAEDGVASLRYDKRGVGESLALAPEESALRFDDYVADLRAVLATFQADRRFGRITVAGHGEGALVAAAALDDRGGDGSRGSAVGARPSARPSLILLAATGETAGDIFSKAIEEAPDEFKAEGRAILASLRAGKSWPKPSSYYEDFFRPSFQAYLSSWLNYDLGAILGRLDGELLFVQGDRDIQESLEDFLSLARQRPADSAVVIEGMNHVLKSVPPEVDANFAAFSDPAYPLPTSLVDAVAAFARGEALPAGLARVDGGVLPLGLAPDSGAGNPTGQSPGTSINSSQH